MSVRMNVRLSGLAETALVPLWARATETQRSNPIIKDEKAVEVMNRIEYDFSRFANAWKTQLGVVIRTRLFDDAVKAFLERHPESIVINLGAGFDSRFDRLDNGTVRWYELDLPEVVEIKRDFFEESDRYRFIAKSLLDYTWMRDVAYSDEPVLIIAEGLLMYFEELELRPLFDHLVSSFPHAEMLVELLAPGAVDMAKYHDTMSKLGVEFKWSLNDGRDLESWNEKIKFVKEWCILDYKWDRWQWMVFFINTPWVRLWFGEKIVHLRFQQNPVNAPLLDHLDQAQRSVRQRDTAR